MKKTACIQWGAVLRNCERNDLRNWLAATRSEVALSHVFAEFPEWPERSASRRG